MEADIVSSLDEVRELKESWKRIYEKSNQGNPFLSWEWNWSWISSYVSDEFIRIVIIKDNDQIICIAPFCIKNREISFLSDSLHSDYMDIVFEEFSSDIIKLLVKKLLDFKDWDKLNLFSFPGNSQSYRCFESELKKHTIYANKQIIHKNPYINTIGNFEDYIASRSNGIKKELRRSKNKLDKTFKKWEFFEAKNLNEKQEVFDALVKLHLRRQDSKVGFSIFDEKKNIDFYNNLIRNREIPWDIYLSGIKADDKFITASISIILNNILYYWITAFDHTLGNSSIGNFHVKNLTEKCFKEKYCRLDFMGGTEIYKMRWATNSFDNYQVVAYKSSLKLFHDKIWMSIKEHLLLLKNNSSFVKQIWVKASKFLGKNKKSY